MSKKKLLTKSALYYKLIYPRISFLRTNRRVRREERVAEQKCPEKTTLKLGTADWQMLQALREALREPTTTGTIRSLIKLVDGIVSYQKQGYRLQLAKNGAETVVVFMPTQPPPSS